MFARTDRLLLRPGWVDDAAILASALAGPATPFTSRLVPARCDDRAHALLARPAEFDRPALLMMERTGTGAELVGTIALEDRQGRVTLDCWVRADRRNRGYATEAGRAMIAIAAMLGLTQLDAAPDGDPAATTLLRKLGFRFTGATAILHLEPDPHGGPVHLLAA
ncbi:GNAT family N-acetyltransferase [Sphingomonas arantia]|uniref:GNAT family N-acetyltransferase n=1 Tax=Sphingomonas arantia TaxID=1460676 RepID=A0ABW4TZ28_9SPHN